MLNELNLKLDSNILDDEIKIDVSYCLDRKRHGGVFLTMLMIKWKATF